LPLALQPPSDQRVRLSGSLADIAAHAMKIKDIPPEKR